MIARLILPFHEAALYGPGIKQEITAAKRQGNKIVSTCEFLDCFEAAAVGRKEPYITMAGRQGSHKLLSGIHPNISHTGIPVHVLNDKTKQAMKRHHPALSEYCEEEIDERVYANAEEQGIPLRRIIFLWNQEAQNLIKIRKESFRRGEGSAVLAFWKAVNALTDYRQPENVIAYPGQKPASEISVPEERTPAVARG